jgi:hypothetical protein
MIQRIQSLWLLLSTVLLVVLLFLPLSTVVLADGTYSVWAFSKSFFGELGIFNPSSLVGVFCILSAVVSLIALFVYMNRKKQMRLVRLSMLFKALTLISLGSLYYFLSRHQSFQINVWASIPLIGLILDFMALHGIRKDEELVRSLDRIR